MIDQNGNTLKVGQTVSFDKWDDSDAKAGPKRVPTKGTVTALAGESLENQTLGTVTITLADKSTVDVAAGGVSVIPEEKKPDAKK